MLGEPRAVAREAEVSRQTVSRLMDNKDGISHRTLENLQAVVAHLRHRSSVLATPDFLTIGTVVPDIAYPLFANVSTLTRSSLSAHLRRWS